jgi:hypothetical protein
MRKAVNWDLNRSDYAGNSPTRTPWTHLLLPGSPGSITKRNLQPYSPGPNLVKARQLAAGHFKDGRITMYYGSSGSTNSAQAQLVKRDLINLGFDPANIMMRGFSGGQIYTAMGRRGTDADIGVSMGWCFDFPDPAQVIESSLVFADESAAMEEEARSRLEARRP